MHACRAQPVTVWEDAWLIAMPGQRFMHSPTVSARAKGESWVISTGFACKAQPMTVWENAWLIAMPSPHLTHTSTVTA